MDQYDNLYDLYYRFTMPLYHLYRGIEQRGIKVNLETRRILDEKYTTILQEKHEKLNSLAGWNVNYNSNAGKNGQVPRLIFGQLGCPKRMSVDDDTLSALKLNVLRKHPKWDRAIETINLVLECRKVHKAIKTYLRARPDIDDRMRTSYNLTKDTGRTSTSIIDVPQRPWKYGLAFQTIPTHADFGSDIRSMLIPDDGMVIVEVDGSQAEARVVMLLAKQYDILEKLDHPLYDLHLLTTSWAFPKDVPPETMDKDGLFLTKELKAQYKKCEKRQVGKMMRHAGHYDMGVREGAMQMGLPEAKVKMLLETFHKNSPNIKQVFHKEIQDYIMETRELWTPIGNRREFFDRLGNQLYKAAYAEIPQNTISHLTKWAMLQSSRAGVDNILMEKHDAFYFQTTEDNLARDCKIAKEYMESEIDFAKCSLPRGKLKIPSEFKVYRNNLMEGQDYKV